MQNRHKELQYLHNCSKMVPLEVESMKIIYDIPLLEQIIENLEGVTKISISFLDANFTPVAGTLCRDDYCIISQKTQSDFLKQCIVSDRKMLKICAQTKKLQRHICHAGLCDGAMPIINENTIVGYVLFGRIRTKDSICPQDNKDLYLQTTFMSEEQIDSFCKLLPKILFNTAIKFEEESLIEIITEYINEHLADSMSIDQLSKQFNVNKNKLYAEIKSHNGVTVNEYITSLRIEKAKQLLSKTDEPISCIAEKVGIFNYGYFTKLFKKKTGLTPTMFRER